VCAECGHAWAGGEQWGSGRAVLGGFHHTATFTAFDGDLVDGSSGLWGSLEQHMWRENAQADDGQGLGMFLSFGFADEDVSACGTALALGVEWTGVLQGRDSDVLGFCICHCDLSDDPAAGTADDETAFELLYKVALTPAVSIKPELQYIANPGGVDATDDVLAALLRIEILF
jgi:porin